MEFRLIPLRTKKYNLLFRQIKHLFGQLTQIYLLKLITMFDRFENDWFFNLDQEMI